ncbi:MAG: hypothetical protein HEQ10_06150 [Dolichospermum sp. DEX182a]|nr:hypothetical protein [Dolichospermum sp. DEX182a]QSV61514.1 MAG: hypothetical protein HEQ26_00810 [Dolichospermum sp. DL01]
MANATLRYQEEEERRKKKEERKKNFLNAQCPIPHAQLIHLLQTLSHN